MHEQSIHPYAIQTSASLWYKYRDTVEHAMHNIQMGGIIIPVSYHGIIYQNMVEGQSIRNTWRGVVITSHHTASYDIMVDQSSHGIHRKALFSYNIQSNDDWGVYSQWKKRRYFMYHVYALQNDTSWGFHTCGISTHKK